MCNVCALSITSFLKSEAYFYIAYKNFTVCTSWAESILFKQIHASGGKLDNVQRTSKLLLKILRKYVQLKSCLTFLQQIFPKYVCNIGCGRDGFAQTSNWRLEIVLQLAKLISWVGSGETFYCYCRHTCRHL